METSACIGSLRGFQTSPDGFWGSRDLSNRMTVFRRWRHAQVGRLMGENCTVLLGCCFPFEFIYLLFCVSQRQQFKMKKYDHENTTNLTNFSFKKQKKLRQMLTNFKGCFTSKQNDKV